MDILYGHMKLEIILPKIIEVKIKRLFWFGYKTEYWIEFECCRSGPYSKQDAEYFLSSALAAYK